MPVGPEWTRRSVRLFSVGIPIHDHLLLGTNVVLTLFFGKSLETTFSRGVGSPESSLRPFPEGAYLAKFVESCKHIHDILATMRDPIWVQAFAKILARKKLHQIVQAYNSFFSSCIELHPVSNVFFRPEEIHRASGVWYVVEPFPERNRYISSHAFRFNAKQDPIANFHINGESTIQTWTIYTDRFTWEEPADHQQLKSSLPEPLLLTVHANSVLGGQVVEGCKRGDQAGVGKQPPWYPC